MSRIYEQLRSLESGIGKPRSGPGHERHERGPATEFPVPDERGAAGRSARVFAVLPSLARGNAQRRLYAAAAVLAVGAGVYALTGTRASRDDNANRPAVPAAPIAAGVVDDAQDHPRQDRVASLAHIGSARHAAASSVKKSRQSAARLKVREEPGSPSMALEKQPAVAFNDAAASATANEMNGWESRSREIRDRVKAGAYAGIGWSAKALARDFPGRWEAWFWLGTAELAQGHTAEAETALENAGAINPGAADIWVQRAVVAQERGNHAEAIRLLSKARELSPNSPQIYLNLGYSSDALGQADKAAESYRRFLALTAGNSTYLAQRKPVIQRLGGGY